MERSNSSYGTSWADQWEHSNPEIVPENNKKKTAKYYGKKVGEGFQKTKAVASIGFKKVKEGTSVGFHWIKDKYNKKTQKH